MIYNEKRTQEKKNKVWPSSNSYCESLACVTNRIRFPCHQYQKHPRPNYHFLQIHRFYIFLSGFPIDSANFDSRKLPVFHQKDPNINI